MTMRFAVAGKGGVGKTTFSALLINEFMGLGASPVLAVDADPNSNLGELLGMKYSDTISDVRDELRDESKIPAGMGKSDYINMRLNEIITEGRGADLIVMGRPEGRECYCYVNEMLRGFLSKLGSVYKVVVIDNEAGMEHLSRRTTDNINALFIVAEPSAASLRAASRIYEISKKIRLRMDKIFLVMNKSDKTQVAGLLPPEVENAVEYAGPVPFDPALAELSEKGEPITKLGEKSPAASAVAEIAAKVTGLARI